MSGPPTPAPERLVSWKAIAGYLQKDVATVRRWEKDFGLPVHRVPGGRGHSVFAFPSDLDDWLKAGPPNGALPDEPMRRQRWTWVGVGAIAAMAVAIAWIARTPRLRAADLRVEATTEGVVARDDRGRERWRLSFPRDYKTILADPGEPLLLVDGRDPAVFLATGFREHQSTGQMESGVLMRLDLDGTSRASFSFDDRVSYGGARIDPPWAMASFAVEDSRDARRIAVTAHHWLWDPSLVTVLDEQWRRLGTFFHAGWIDKVHWLSPDRLLVNGYSNAHEGGMVTLLDPAGLEGQGAEQPGSRHSCDTCSSAGPLRMSVMPRTEVNRASGSPFNRAVVQVTAGRITARTIEVPSDGQGAVDAVYEFTPSLDLVRASFSERYWEAHRVLEAQGKLKHARTTCPDREGPRTILEWTAASGWTTRAVTSAELSRPRPAPAELVRRLSQTSHLDSRFSMTIRRKE